MENMFYPSYEDAEKNFNFEEVLEYMKNVNWNWCFPFESECRVPLTINELKECTYQLYSAVLLGATWGESYWMETGGFRVEFNEEHDVKISFNFKY